MRNKNGNKTLWTIHAAEDAPFLDKNIIYINFPELGDLSDLRGKEDFKARYDQIYPDQNPVARTSGANLIFRLVRELQTGDYILYQHGSYISLGEISGEYEFNAADPGFEQKRSVEWKNALPSSGFSKAALREMNASPLGLFAVKRYTGEFFSAWGVPYLEDPESVTRAKREARETDNKARELNSANAFDPQNIAAAFHNFDNLNNLNNLNNQDYKVKDEDLKSESVTRSCTLEDLNQAFEKARDFPEFLANVFLIMGAPAGCARLNKI